MRACINEYKNFDKKNTHDHSSFLKGNRAYISGKDSGNCALEVVTKDNAVWARVLNE